MRPTTTTTPTEAAPIEAAPTASFAIAVVTHDSLADLERCFASHEAASRRLGADLVAVDNASSDGTLQFLRARERESRRIRVVAMPRNAGYAAAVNAAFAATGSRDVLLVNPDVSTDDPGALGDLVEFLRRRPDVALVAPRLHGADGEAQPSARRFPSLPALLGTLDGARRIAPLRRAHEAYVAPSAATRAVAVDWAIGAAMLIRRAAFDAVGGWDERFFLYMEDTDFCRRCNAAGWRVVYLPTTALEHGYRRASSRSASIASSSARRHHVAGLARLFGRDPRMIVGRSRARVEDR